MQYFCGYHAGDPRLCDHKCYTLAINILRPENSAQLPPHNQPNVRGDDHEYRQTKATNDPPMDI